MKKYLIVGQGVAGSFLGLELIKRKMAVTIVDDSHKGSSSVISAGIINPIIGKRFTVSPDFAVYYPAAITAYTQLEKQFSQTFFKPMSILRIFRDNEERIYGERAFNDSDAKGYVLAMNPPGVYPHLLDTFGSILIGHAGYCKTEAMLMAFREYFNQAATVNSSRFDYDNLLVADEAVTYAGKSYDGVIFCEGFKAQFNPLFSWVPFNSAKGEILKLRQAAAVFPPDTIINRGQWAIPTSEGWSVGSNYNWDDLNCIPTEEGKNEILSGLEYLLAGEKEVVAHQAGVRPIVKDQKAILGSHPEMPRVFIFNGLGTKGFLTAPLLATCLADHICDNAIIPPELSVRRFKAGV